MRSSSNSDESLTLSCGRNNRHLGGSKRQAASSGTRGRSPRFLASAPDSIACLKQPAAHKSIFPPRGPLSRFGHFVSCHLARIGGGVPDFYPRSI
jgi:hypothetical protein